jgi:hypothetical protein
MKRSMGQCYQRPGAARSDRERANNLNVRHGFSSRIGKPGTVREPKFYVGGGRRRDLQLTTGAQRKHVARCRQAVAPRMCSRPSR